MIPLESAEREAAEAEEGDGVKANRRECEIGVDELVLLEFLTAVSVEWDDEVPFVEGEDGGRLIGGNVYEASKMNIGFPF